MPKEQISSTTQAVIEKIKENPNSFVPNKTQLQKVIVEREKADQRLKEAGITVILHSV